MTIIKINPSNISPSHSKKLADFFNSQPQNVQVWKAGIPYTFKDGTQFKFTSDVVRRERKEGNPGYRYEFISNRLLGRGQFGEVYQIEGTLAVDTEGVRFKPYGLNKKRAIKIQRHNSNFPSAKVIKEYNLTKDSSRLKVKKPTIEGTTSYTVMKQLQGKDLFDIIDEDIKGMCRLTTDQRIKITHSLLIGLKEQITDKGIIHRDVKGENIFVDLTSPTIEATFFDFGLGVKATELDGESPGTAAYAPPELFLWGKQTVKIDVFSLGRVIALIWHVDIKNYGLSNLDDIVKNAKNVNLNSLFSGLTNIDDNTKKIIRSMLQGMLRANVDSRFTIEQAIACFAQIKGNDLRVNSNLSTTNTSAPLSFDQINAQIDALLSPDNQSDLNDKKKKLLAMLAEDLKRKIQLLSSPANPSKEEFQTQVNQARQLITQNKETFENHKVGYILANIGFALMTIGLAHLALASYSLVKGKKEFGFFKEIKTTKTTALCEAIDLEFSHFSQNRSP